MLEFIDQTTDSVLFDYFDVSCSISIQNTPNFIQVLLQRINFRLSWTLNSLQANRSVYQPLSAPEAIYRASQVVAVTTCMPCTPCFLLARWSIVLAHLPSNLWHRLLTPQRAQLKHITRLLRCVGVQVCIHYV